MCGNALVESNNMARSFLENKNQNYSHCPLKKRPLAYFLQQSVTETENTPVAPSIADEPEDLSVKSENRSASTYRDHRRLRALLEAAEIYSPPPAHQPVISRSPVQHQHKQQQQMVAETKLSGKLEPLSVSAARESPNIFSTASLPSSVLAPYHPTYPPYLPFNFPFPSYVVQPGVPHYPVTPLRHSPSRHEQLSPFAPRDSHSPSVTSTSRVFSADAPEAAASFIKHTDIDVEDLSSAAMSPDSESSTTTTSSSSKRRKISSSARFHCPDCQKSYSTYCGLTKHQELHCAQQSKKSFSCKHCDKVYVSLGALKMHIRTHTLPCKCTVCGKAFSRPWLLQGHIRTHTGEKPFSCQHCSRSFADRSNLRAHLQTHSDVKRYSCKGCDKTFSRMSLLSKHEASGCPQGSISKRDMA